ncbi:hypothetical protein [uncultured Succinivibrio sp.]|uniref:hypothetical protein n=1 Tax=uncultured Succinivibrio sp. TaxID=540749 RepID=UPI0025E7E308|nr:hypothetical protein [uncultured Succinivibrio sp.]
MSKKNILPFALGALAGASLLAVAALCCGQDDNKDKKSLNPASLVKELNQFFFSITGMQIKLQSILSKISKAELEDLNLSYQTNILVIQIVMRITFITTTIFRKSLMFRKCPLKFIKTTFLPSRRQTNI